MMIATAELRKRSQDHSREFKVTARRLADFVASVEAEESLLVQRLQDPAARRIHGCPDDRYEAAIVPQPVDVLDTAEPRLPVAGTYSVPQTELYEEY